MRALRHLHHILQWNLSGKPLPAPHEVKQRAIKYYQKRFGPEVFVETGTYLGDMVAAVMLRFKEVYSVELSPELYERAQRMFAGQRHVHILQGDSSDVLRVILLRITEPSLFWLDGHFSGGITARGSIDFPVLQELECISEHKIKNHVILIDDARLFGNSANVPSKRQVIESLRTINRSYTIEEKDDIIRAFVVEQ
jgi:hypothetical protein